MDTNRTALHEAAARGDIAACKAEIGHAVGPNAVRKVLEARTLGFAETALVCCVGRLLRL